MRPFVLTILLVASAGSHAQVTRYVTDSLKLEVRSGPDVKNRVIRMLPSGMPLKILEQRDGWSRIELEGEAEAWILTRYLMSEPSARNEVSEAKALREQLSTATNTAQSMAIERSQLAARVQDLTQEFAQLKLTAASAVAVKEENERLRVSSADNERGLQDLRQEYLLLKQSRERDWFITGAAVLFAGIVLGLLIPKLKFRRRRGWGEL